jgi:hypothetical protein
MALMSHGFAGFSCFAATSYGSAKEVIVKFATNYKAGQGLSRKIEMQYCINLNLV